MKITHINEAGYSGFSMSNNAVDAYMSGEMPLSKWTKQAIIDRVEKIDSSKVDLVKQLPITILKDKLLWNSSWHHTSMHYNKTEFYSIDEDVLATLTQEVVNEWISQQGALKNKQTKQALDIRKGDIDYLTWGGTRNYPKAIEHSLKDVNIETRGQFYIVTNDKGIELVRKKIGSNGTRVTFKESLNESKEDWERFREYLKSNTENYTDKQIDDYIKYFQLNKERLSPLSRDIYFWLKQDPYDFFTTVDELKATKTNKQVEDEAKQGAELKAENDNYRVYKINNYGASCKYGANTKWCITSKFRPDYKDYYWQRYSNGNDIYFIISKHPTNSKWDKIAFLKDKFYGDDDDVIYDAEDNSYTKFPSIVAKELKGMSKFDGIDLNNYMELYSKEDIDKYKELLDKNLITQDEFNRRKEQSVLEENLSLKESISKVEDTYITYSVNDVLAFLEDKDESYRIVYDTKEQMYLLGDAIETIHHELVFTAYNNGYLDDQKEFIDRLGNIDNYIDYGQGGQFIKNGNGEDEEVDQYLFYIVYNPKGNNDLDFEVDGYDRIYKGVRGDLLTRDSKLEDTPLYSAWTRYNKQLESSQQLQEDFEIVDDDNFVKYANKYIFSLSQNELLNQAHIKETTTFDDGPMFILPNGNLLNPNNYEMQVGLPKDEMTHGAFLLYVVDSIMRVLNFDTHYSSAISDYILEEVTQRLGWIRVNSGSNSVEERCYIVIPSQSGKRPTSAQYDTLLEWFEYIQHSVGQDFVRVMIGDSNKTQQYNLQETFSEDVISNIKRYYSSGNLYENMCTEDIWDKSGEIYQLLKDSKYLKLQKKPINTLSLDEIKYLYAINRAGSSFVRYDSVELAIKKEIDSDKENSWDSEIFDTCYDYLHSLNFPLTIYRAIRPDEINKDGSFNISGKNNSRSWSTNINIYKNKSSSFRNLNNIVSAKIDSNVINNSATIVNYYFYTGGRNVRKQNYGEYEISLKKNFKQTDLHELQPINKDTITESLLDKAKDYFGTTYFKKLASYLNTDGTYLDFSGERFGNVGATTRSQDHREIADIIDNAESGTDAMYQYMNGGNIRLMPEAPGVDIIKEPTEKQYAQLKDYIDYFLYKEKVFYIDISDSNGNNIKSFEYSYPTKVDSIIEDIKNYFKGK